MCNNMFIHFSVDVFSSWSQPSEMYISTGDEIIQLQASSGDNLTTRVLFNGLEEVQDLDVDRQHNYVYWVDTILKTINRAKVFNNSNNNYETVGGLTVMLTNFIMLLLV